MRVLQTRLLLLKREEEAAKKKELAGTITASWGDQMRSYFLYGQQLVKDLRTGYEVGNRPWSSTATSTASSPQASAGASAATTTDPRVHSKSASFFAQRCCERAAGVSRRGCRRRALRLVTP